MKKFNSLVLFTIMFMALMLRSGLFETKAAPTADSISITLYVDLRDTINLQSYDPAVMYVTGHWSPGPTPGDPNWTFIEMDSIAGHIFSVTFKYGVGHFAGNTPDDPDLFADCPGWYFAPTNDWSTAENVPAPCNVAWDVQRIFTIDVNNPDTVVAFKYGQCDPVPLSSLGIEGLTDIEEVTTQNLIVYPNPTSGIINIDLSSFNSRALVEVLDISGRIITKIENASVKATLDISSMNSGIYLIRVSDGMSSVYKKIILH